MTEAQEMPEIKRVDIDFAAVDEYSSEEDFMKLAVDLLVEAGQYVCVAACLLPGDRKAWCRNEAILGGLLVRMFKLISAMLDQTCQRRRETSMVMGRLAFECVINIKYLIKHGSDETFDAYVAYSLRHERRLFDEIQKNIDARGGDRLPIERRMAASIQQSAESAGIALDEVSKDTFKLWKDQTFYSRAEAVGMGPMYLSFIGGGSHSVHGNWQDLLEYHLDESEAGFTPELEWHQPRPQVLLILAIFVVDMVKEYLVHLVGEHSEPVQVELDDLSERIWGVNDRHEAFLTARQSA